MEQDIAELKFGYDPKWIDSVIELFNKTEMKRDNPLLVDRAFRKSQVVASIWHREEGSLLAIGRMLTDFEMYSSIFDVVVNPAYQKHGLGKRVVKGLMNKAPNTCIYLTSTFGNESFYLKQGFHFHKTAMAHYPEFFGKTPYLDWERQ